MGNQPTIPNGRLTVATGMPEQCNQIGTLSSKSPTFWRARTCFTLEMDAPAPQQSLYLATWHHIPY